MTDEEVDRIEDFIVTSWQGSHTPKYIANFVQIPIDLVNFVLMEFVREGWLYRRGSYYRRIN